MDPEDHRVSDESYDTGSDYEGDSDCCPSFDSDHSDDLADHRQKKKTYTILNEEDIVRKQEDDVSIISSSLSVSRAMARILLQRFKWNVIDVLASWFADEVKIPKSVGLVEYPLVEFSNSDELSCGICFNSYLCDEKIRSAVFCGHSYCNTCWGGYISTAIKKGPGCVSLRCPKTDCDAAVSEDLVNLLVSEEDKKKYDEYCMRSYVEGNKIIKWCPAPGCKFAVEYDDGIGIGVLDVSCDCSCNFCWKCMEDAHRPVDCDTAAKWVSKNTAESTKPCPKCRRPIEKNGGCMHMTCWWPCTFEFCWVCLRAWSSHGYEPCNGYEGSTEEGELDEGAMKSLERYRRCYERWDANHRSMIADLHEMQNVDELVAKHAQTTSSQLGFVAGAWVQIVECRRVLKWTYVYGYYLSEEEVFKTRLFEYWQGVAEVALEELHHCAEKELTSCLHQGTADEFNDTSRSKLVNLTRVTGNYFANLVTALENGLADVDSNRACSATSPNKMPKGE